MVIAAISIYLATFSVSMAHGRDMLSKGLLMALHWIVIAGAGAYSGHPIAAIIAASILTPAYWFLSRGGRAAGAEQDIQSRQTTSGAEAIKAHAIFSPLLCWLVPVICRKYEYEHLYPPSDFLTRHQAGKRMGAERDIALFVTAPHLVAYFFILGFVL
jgi:hypothetical protein